MFNKFLPFPKKRRKRLRKANEILNIFTTPTQLLVMTNQPIDHRFSAKQTFSILKICLKSGSFETFEYLFKRF